MARKYMAPRQSEQSEPVVTEIAGTGTEPSELDKLKEMVNGMTDDELSVYVAAEGIDIGAATSRAGIVKKVFAHLETRQ